MHLHTDPYTCTCTHTSTNEVTWVLPDAARYYMPDNMVKEFTEKAAKLRHPFDNEESVTDDLIKAAFDLLTKGPEMIAMRRASTMKHYEDLSKKWSREESMIHSKIASEKRREILKDKKMWLLGKMCKDAGIKDGLLTHHLATGVPLVGEACSTGEIPAKVKLNYLQLLIGCSTLEGVLILPFPVLF